MVWFTVGVSLLLTPLLFASEDIRHTKHNLAANPDIKASDGTLRLNQEICVFCHTPHGGRTDVAGGGAPLWNRRIPPNPDQNSSYYIPYSSPNFDAQDTTNTPGKPKGVSLDCLSCHDGTIGFDALINFPGSGGFFATNQSGVGFGGTVGLFSFTGPAANTGSVGDVTSFNEQVRDNTAGGFAYFQSDGVTPSGISGAAPFPNLGTDLSDDHPISMAIPCGSDPQFDEICNGIQTKGGRIQGTNSVMYISRDPSGGGSFPLPTDKRDRLRAYPSNPSNLNEPYIECASCHNPHEASGNPNYPAGQPPASVDPISNPGSVNNALFLRMASFVGADTQNRNRGSLVCLSCHQK
jgi:cytochrome c553